MTPLPLHDYRNIVLLTGAGVSAASGLGTYRGPGGLWEQADIARIADARNLPGTLPDLWRLYSGRRQKALDAGPNTAHAAIANLQKRWEQDGSGTVTLFTQNVDGLHQRAGSPEVIELHGSAFMTRCTRDDCSLVPFRDESAYEAVPACPECGSPLRPAVVLFGETLAEAALERAGHALQTCDLFIAVGTSGVVWPAARFAAIASHSGARTVLVNLEKMNPPDPSFDEEYLGRAEEILPVLLDCPGV